MNIEPGERSLVISSNCRAFTFDTMYGWDQRTMPRTMPRRFNWWERTVMRFYNCWFVDGWL